MRPHDPQADRGCCPAVRLVAVHQPVPGRGGLMNRERMVREVVEVLVDEGFEGDDELEVAGRILDAILPRVTTVEELEALPDRTRLVGPDGDSVQKFNGWVRVDAGLWAGGSTAAKALRDFSPLTVVWQP